MSLDKCNIREDDFDIFVLLSERNKIEFLYDITKGNTAKAVLKQIAKIEKLSDDSEFRLAHVEDLMVGTHRLCITKYDNVITFNCDNLAIINRFVNKIWNDGQILIRNNEAIKTHLDCYKYFKAFNILNIGMPISGN